MWILCLAEDSLKTSRIIFSEKTMEKYLWMSSAADMIGALRDNYCNCPKIEYFGFTMQ